MGNSTSVSWQTDAASPSGEDVRSVVSSPIKAKDVTPAMFWDACEKATRRRKAIGWEKDYKCRTLADGGFVAMSTYPLPVLGNTVVYSTVHVDRLKDMAIFKMFMTDASLDDANHASTSYLRAVTGPFRLEWWTDDHALRLSNQFVLMPMLELMGKMGSKAPVQCSQPSPSGSGQLCVLAGPIEDCATTADSFLDFIRSQLQKDGAKLQADGMMLEEAKSWFLPTVYRRHSVDAANGQLVTYNYESDKSLRALKATSYMKVHRDPFRLELWALQSPSRLSGDEQKEVASQLVGVYLKHMD